jgi:hypothetical protein|tara:strand:- start:308 stop:610 length:303 start_codon:yes stop_codon:yes gene_type:complete
MSLLEGGVYFYFRFSKKQRLELKMSSALSKSNHRKLWVIFSVFILIILALLGVQVNNFIDAKDQRGNVEELRKAQTKFINSTVIQASKDSIKAPEENIKE